MRFYINVKALGKLKASVEQVPFEIEHEPGDVRSLINETVAVCVAGFRERAAQQDILTAMTSDEIRDRALSGKIAFGAIRDSASVDLQEAQNNALQSFEDGIYRIFLDGKQLESLDEKININENSQLTFVRLTMLAGRLW